MKKNKQELQKYGEIQKKLNEIESSLLSSGICSNINFESIFGSIFSSGAVLKDLISNIETVLKDKTFLKRFEVFKCYVDVLNIRKEVKEMEEIRKHTIQLPFRVILHILSFYNFTKNPPKLLDFYGRFVLDSYARKIFLVFRFYRCEKKRDFFTGYWRDIPKGLINVFMELPEPLGYVTFPVRFVVKEAKAIRILSVSVVVFEELFKADGSVNFLHNIKVLSLVGDYNPDGDSDTIQRINEYCGNLNSLTLSSLFFCEDEENLEYNGSVLSLPYLTSFKGNVPEKEYFSSSQILVKLEIQNAYVRKKLIVRIVGMERLREVMFHEVVFDEYSYKLFEPSSIRSLSFLFVQLKGDLFRRALKHCKKFSNELTFIYFDTMYHNFENEEVYTFTEDFFRVMEGFNNLKNINTGDILLNRGIKKIKFGSSLKKISMSLCVKDDFVKDNFPIVKIILPENLELIDILQNQNLSEVGNVLDYGLENAKLLRSLFLSAVVVDDKIIDYICGMDNLKELHIPRTHYPGIYHVGVSHLGKTFYRIFEHKSLEEFCYNDKYADISEVRKLNIIKNTSKLRRIKIRVNVLKEKKGGVSKLHLSDKKFYKEFNKCKMLKKISISLSIKRDIQTDGYVTKECPTFQISDLKWIMDHFQECFAELITEEDFSAEMDIHCPQDFLLSFHGNGVFDYLCKDKYPFYIWKLQNKIRLIPKDFGLIHGNNNSNRELNSLKEKYPFIQRKNFSNTIEELQHTNVDKES